MSSNKSLRISLKIRLALLYTLLFFISCSLIFVVASLRIYREINRVGDEELFRMTENIQEICANALNPDPGEELADPRRTFPENDLKILEQRFPGMELLSSRKQEALEASNSNAHRHYVTATIFHNGQFYECRVRTDGSVYSKLLKKTAELDRLRRRLNTPHETPEAAAQRALKRHFSQLNRTLGQNEFFIAVWDADAQKCLFKAGANFKKFAKVLNQAEAPLAGFETGRFRCIYDELPGFGYLVAGYSIANRDTLIRQCMIIFFGILLSGTGIGIAVAWLIARRFIRGIKQTTLAMQNIAAGDYSYRIKIPYNDEEIVTLMENFNEMNERTENLLNEIRMMSDNVAHDLRTPLTRISGTVELLLTRRELPAEVRDVCISVLEETLRLKALVNTIMDISRTTAHPDSLKKELLDLKALAEKFCEFMLPAFEERSLELKVTLPETPLFLEADRTMVQRLLANLIENALKFTDSGSVELSLASANNKAVLQIRDSGCGISAKDLPHIFDRFYRADASRHRSGNGLGLALVKAVVNAHKWEMDVTSTPGTGTAFTITIPLTQTGNNK
ncbi:MAG: HAMP domain-containing histidine kinase [Lentisphaeria bacterium]|nr:HAMP domain-containing histidine kinase [Lentisphaeria bacterium]